MKKSFFVLIAAVFLLSVVYVGINGLEIQPPWDSRIYVDRVECKSYQVDEDRVEMTYSESLKKYNSVIDTTKIDTDTFYLQLLPKAYPDNATILGTAEGGIVGSVISMGKNEYAYKYIYSGNIVSIDQKGVVSLTKDEFGFVRTGVATIIIQAADGSGASTSIQLLIK